MSKTVAKEITKDLAKAGAEIVLGALAGEALDMLLGSESRDAEILAQLNRIETAIEEFQKMAKSEFSRLGLDIKSTDARQKVNELKSLLNGLQRYHDAAVDPSSSPEDLNEQIKQRCADISEKTMTAVELIYDSLVTNSVASKSLLLSSWEDIMSRPVDPVDAYKAIKSLSLWYQSALGTAKVLLTWQQANDKNKVAAKIAAASIKELDTLVTKWDQALEVNGDCVLPFRVINWANAFLPEERKGVPIEVAWDAFREPYPAERNIYGVRLTQPPPQSYFKTGLQVWKGIQNYDINNTDMVFRIFRDNDTSTYTIGVGNALPGIKIPQTTPGTNRLGVWIAGFSDYMPTPIYHNYERNTPGALNAGWPSIETVRLVFQIEPTTVTNATSSNFGMTIKGAPGTRVAGRGLKFGDNDYFRFNSDDKHGKYQFRIFPRSMPKSNVPIIST